MDISKEEIKHIADLSNLTILDSDLENYVKDMSGVVDFVHQLNELDTENVDITTSIIGEYNIFRKDEVKESLNRDFLLKNAPSNQDGMFKIPKVIGG